jgi:hypothetical protein
LKRRNFIKAVPLAGMAGAVRADSTWWPVGGAVQHPANEQDRAYWVGLLTRIATPVLLHLSKGQLKQFMPKEVAPHYGKPVEKVTYLEAFARTMAGVAPWLELGADNTPEGKERGRLIQYARAATAQAVDTASPDYMNFTGKHDGQPLVDGAFLAHAFLRAPKQLWEPLPQNVKQQVIAAFKSLREIKPGYNNWLLFAAIIEAALLQFGDAWDPMRVDYALKKHEEWYKGDGLYGDGPHFHFDYYNAFVIHPMLADIIKVLVSQGKASQKDYDRELKRMQRYGVILERMISPEGTFPVVGRSMTYRNAAFQPLVQLVLEERLPEELSPAQVRCALTSVMKNIFEAPGNFDKEGWLQLGFCGHQPEIADVYTSTGSLYLCTTGFLALGLPPGHLFWTAEPQDWTAKKVWKGRPVGKDHAIDD